MRYTKLVIQRVWLIVLYSVLFTVPALAVDKIDTGFGDNGFVVKDFGIGDDEALALAVQPDGKLLVAGYSDNGAVKNIIVARYLPDGTPDISFNYDGVFVDSMGSGDSVAFSLAVQSDGRIFVTGSTFDMEPRLAVIALTEDGYLDSGFGDNGQVIFSVQGEAIVTADLEVAPDGFIIIAATVERSDAGRYPLFAKISSGGEFVPEFGKDGVVIQESEHSTEVRSLALLNEGKILAAGSIELDGVAQAGLLMFNADGTPDMMFGEEGELLLSVEGLGSVVNDLFVESGESILLAGSVKNKNYSQAFAVRLMKDGTLDPHFAGNGMFRSSLEYDSTAYGISVQQDETIVLAGFALSGQGKDVIVWSIPDNDMVPLSSDDKVILDSEQQIVLRGLSVSDSNIGEADIETDIPVEQSSDQVATSITTDIAGGDDASYAAVTLASGQIVVAGSSNNGIDKDIALVSYTSEDMSMELLSESASKGVVTGVLRVITSPIEDITRVGAVSGGIISVTTGLSCETSCTENGVLDTVCSESCLDKRTVEKRGVVFSVYKNPVYRLETTVPADGDVPTDTESIFVYDANRAGQTEDGSGIGAYGSDIQDIIPDAIYYVRAYAVLADDTVIYGNQLTFKTDDACFIATAAYGSLLDTHVILLRQFRDTYLMPYSFGRRVVRVYYYFSPPLADLVDENALLRSVVRVSLWPLIALALFMLKVTSTVKVITVLITFLGVGLYVKLTQVGEARSPGKSAG